MRDKSAEKECFMKSMSREEYENLEPEDKILTVLDEEWAELPPDEQAARGKKAADGADKHILLARARRAREQVQESNR